MCWSRTHADLPQVGGRLAYVPQQAWIMNATLKENVLFGKPFDEQRWDEVIEVSLLASRGKGWVVLPAQAGKPWV